MDFEEYNIPEWDKAGKVHDWRNYINDKLRSIWWTFDINQKRIIAESAQKYADGEEWD